MSRFYFAYGSNMNPQRMAERGMQTLSAQAASLSGWQLCFNKRCPVTAGTAYANIVPVAAGRVPGVLYELANLLVIERMDPFENWPERYRREKVGVQVSSGIVETWVYIANPEWQQEGLRPQRWYLNHLLAGRPWLPPEHYETLRSTVCF